MEIHEFDLIQPIFIKHLILEYKDEYDTVEIISANTSKWLTSIRKEWEIASHSIYNLSWDFRMNNRLSEGDWKIPHRGNTGERNRFVELNLKVWATAVNSAGRQMQEGKEGKWNSDAGTGPASHIRREKVIARSERGKQLFW